VPGNITPAKQRAAVELVVRFTAGVLDPRTAEELGSMLIGRDLSSRSWRLTGWRTRRAALEGAGYRALRRVLKRSFTPQRVRLGTEYIKTAAGAVDYACVPASLPPAHLAWWLRRRFFHEIEKETDRLVTPLAAANVVSDFSRRSAMNPALVPDPPSPPAQEFFGELAEALTEREREVLALRLAEVPAPEIGRRLAVTDRTVRREYERIRQKAKAFPFELQEPDEEERSTAPVTNEALRKLIRPMTPEEWADRCAGYPASRYRRRASVGLAPVLLLATHTPAARPEPDNVEAVADKKVAA
jgi:hypothetical protein